MINSLRKYKKQLKAGMVLAMVVASLALVWSSVNAPERARNALSVAMERNSSVYFSVERDITALARDTHAGTATSIGLSAEYALVDLADGTHYYVRIDGQRLLVTETLKAAAGATTPAVFALGDVQPPGSPLPAQPAPTLPSAASSAKQCFAGRPWKDLRLARGPSPAAR